ncbi:hypothetical protein EYW49_09260 [Siculibacillus lacustris]|uniref:Uncharacterized protein n=1 Tax=Siculibacillus lacustris TaxID=1549641 RepID=A0A4V2KTS9_9HYPH|nr:hypothetical protein [Siculibacillus lacustris]TBW38447.1 hypothetical protein EYW49_09260 [Siculibacillus lacustris]
MSAKIVFDESGEVPACMVWGPSFADGKDDDFMTCDPEGGYARIFLDAQAGGRLPWHWHVSGAIVVRDGFAATARDAALAAEAAMARH